MPAALNAVMGAIGELLRIPAHLVSLRTGAALMDERTSASSAKRSIPIMCRAQCRYGWLEVANLLKWPLDG